MGCLFPCARPEKPESIAGMNKGKKIALAVAGWVAVCLSLYAVFVILNTWFLAPDDPALSQSANIKIKLEIIACFAASLIGLIAFARWSFRKRNSS
jgi:hypothetical protein